MLGLLDALFLTYEHYTLTSIGCPISPWINCLAVTTSRYSLLFGIPLSLYGVIYYLFMLFCHYIDGKVSRSLFLVTSIFGVIFSIYLIYVQTFLIGLFCLYCLISSLISFLILGFSLIRYSKNMNTLIIDLMAIGYKYFVKHILFLFDATKVHEGMVDFGKSIIKYKFIKNLFKLLFVKKYENLKQEILGLNFLTPLGLAAGFDYEAKLFNVTPQIGFGFETIGTVTNGVYGGNPSPQLGRLPKSQSLLVNKGFKSAGALGIIKRLKNKKFVIPIGISIGRTNSAKLDTVEKSIKDIVSAFKKFETGKVNNFYYELNISCPNIIYDMGISFYDPKDLEKLLVAVDKLKIKKPIFIKVPIDQTEDSFLKLLKIIDKHKIAGVVIGNLQTNKNNKSLVKGEVDKFTMGKYSGKPTFEDSNRFIRLTYQNYKKRFVIVGCGGVFNADDAWVKFTNGASLVQLITGMIFEGPQLMAQINSELSEKLKEKGYSSISEVVGSEV